jgi:hypothetical protein
VTSCEQGCIHPGCDRPPRVCRECVRARSLRWWGAIARHNGAAPRCELCEFGHAEICGECFVDDVTEHRAQMRRLGNRMGEPEPPDVFEIYARGIDEGRRLEREGTRAMTEPIHGGMSTLAGDGLKQRGPAVAFPTGSVVALRGDRAAGAPLANAGLALEDAGQRDGPLRSVALGALADRRAW